MDKPEEKKEEEKEVICVACGHTFHFDRCFVTIEVGRNYSQCQCKKGVREDD